MEDPPDDKQVVLRNVSLSDTPGDFKCQVSGEGPLFNTVFQTKALRVAVVPQQRPKIEGLPANFKPGSWLNLNCTAGASLPATRLTWFVNGKQVSNVLIFYPKGSLRNSSDV